MELQSLLIDVDSPFTIFSSVAAAIVAVVLQILFRPSTEQKPKSRKSDIKAAAAVLIVTSVIAFLFWEADDALKRRRTVDVNHPRAAHFVICGFSFAFLTISRIVLVPLFAMIGESLVPHSKWHGERELHVQRFAGQLWKAIYHSVVTIAPLWFLRNEPWWPPGLGDPKMLFVDYPLTPPVPVLREYYMFQLGYYFHALFATLMQRGRPNYVSMTIHHMSTIALVSCSFFVQNNPRLGTLVFWVHDVCDVPVCLTRLAVDLSSTAATAVFYVLLIATWVVFRLAIFPLSIIRAVSWDAIHEGWVPWPEAYAWIPLTLFLLLLLCMHFQWFFELLGMARVYFATGKALDSTETDKGSRLSSQSKNHQGNPAQPELLNKICS